MRWFPKVGHRRSIELCPRWFAKHKQRPARMRRGPVNPFLDEVTRVTADAHIASADTKAPCIRHVTCEHCASAWELEVTMPVEIIGLLSLTNGSEMSPSIDKFQPNFVGEYARAYEAAGYDRVLVAQTARCADSMMVAAQVASSTQRLQLMIAHRPGFVAPTMAARMLATMDQFSGGRVGVHIITAANDAELRNDGDYLTKDERYRRSHEYVDILRAIWENEKPIDYSGEFYKFEQAFSEVKPYQSPSIPVFWGGSTAPGLEAGGACCDIYAMGGRNLESVTSLVAEVRAVAARNGRSPDFCMSIRIILGKTEAEAWANADDILQKLQAHQTVKGGVGADQGDEYHKRRLALALAAKASAEPCLWTGLAEATGGRGNVVSLVGTSEQVSDALMAYYAHGVTRFLITGFHTIASAPRDRRRAATPACVLELSSTTASTQPRATDLKR